MVTQVKHNVFQQVIHHKIKNIELHHSNYSILLCAQLEFLTCEVIFFVLQGHCVMSLQTIYCPAHDRHTECCI